MQITEFLEETFIDYPGKIVSSVVFTPGCNYRSPACYSKHIIEGNGNYSEDKIFSYLDSRKGWIEGVVLCGGEPTLQLGLKSFIRQIKKRGLPVKLDTNGSNFSVLAELRDENLIDYIAMDVKGPESLYPCIVGKDHLDFRDEVEKGMVLATQFPNYEFRTTIVPIDRNKGKINFMTVNEAVDMAKWIVKRTGSNEHKYFLQPFVPHKGELVDSRFEKFLETSKELLGEMKEAVSKYLPMCDVR